MGSYFLYIGSLLFLGLIAWFLLYIKRLSSRNQMVLTAAFIGRNPTEISKLLRSARIAPRISVSEGTATIRFSEKRLAHVINFDFTDDICTHVKWTFGGLTARNLEFMKHKDFDKVWEKVTRDGYLEAYMHQVNPLVNKRYIAESNQFLGISDDGFVTYETFSKGKAEYNIC